MNSPIVAGDLVLRLWNRADASAIGDLVTVSRVDFDRWLPTLTPELADFEAFVERVTRSAGEGTAWHYCIDFDGVPVGQCSIELRDERTAEIGYWIRSDRTNEGLATRAVRSLYGPAADHGIETLVIHCDEGNQRSAAVAQRAGFVHVATLELDASLPRTDAQTGREMTWHLSLVGGRLV